MSSKFPTKPPPRTGPHPLSPPPPLPHETAGDYAARTGQRSVRDIDHSKPLVEAMQVLRLEPGDVLVLKVRDRLRDEQVAEMAKRLQDATKAEKVIVLQDGMELCVVRKEV